MIITGRGKLNRPLKIVLVTSQVTYVPGNYLELFERLMQTIPQHLSGLIILDNFSLQQVQTALGLFFIGARKTACQLLRNILELPRQRRERLFKEKSKQVWHATSMNDPHILQLMRQDEIDLILNLRTRCIYGKDILTIPRLGCLNVHHGILPKYRGTMCDLYAIADERSPGFSIHKMTEKIDAGEILKIHTHEEKSSNNYQSYLARIMQEEARIISELIREISHSGELPQGVPNQCERPSFSKNPNRKKIKSIIEQGILL